MTLNDLQIECSRTINTQLSNAERLTEGAFGLSGETGEVVDEIKKSKYQGHPLDTDRIMEELGDVLWYVAEIATACDIPLDSVAAYLISKLAQRYPHGFDPARSINRRRESNGSIQQHRN